MYQLDRSGSCNHQRTTSCAGCVWTTNGPPPIRPPEKEVVGCDHRNFRCRPRAPGSTVSHLLVLTNHFDAGVLQHTAQRVRQCDTSYTPPYMISVRVLDTRLRDAAFLPVSHGTRTTLRCRRSAPPRPTLGPRPRSRAGIPSFSFRRSSLPRTAALSQSRRATRSHASSTRSRRTCQSQHRHRLALRA
jgi:hypothetical protein